MFSALIFLRPRPTVLGAGPSSPTSPQLVLMASIPGPLASPETRFVEGSTPWRIWLLLDVGVAGVMASDVLLFTVRDDSAIPKHHRERCYRRVCVNNMTVKRKSIL